jgi:HlyD family secretion protein
MRRWLVRLLILAVLVGAAVAAAVPAVGWWQRNSTPKYLTAEVTRGRVETVVNSTGTVKPVRTVSVGAFTSGPIEKVYVDYNSPVEKGAKLALIDPKLAEAAVARDEAALKHDRAAQKTQEAELVRVTALCEQARKNKDRALALVKINKDYLSDTDQDQYKYALITAEAQVDLAQANVHQAEAAVSQSEANLANSNANLGYTSIVAPEAGVVIERKVDRGQTVAASFQTPELFVIAPEMDQHMYVYASVDEADVGQIQAAQANDRVVKFTVDAYPSDLFEGHIHQIRKNSTTTQNVVTYPVVIEAPNPGMKLMPGMTANISFQIDFKDDVLRVPVAALRFVPQPAQVRPEDRHYADATPAGAPEAVVRQSASEKAEQYRNRNRRVVWVQDGPLLRAVPLTVGLVEHQFAEVVDGDLAEGQALVTGVDSVFGTR